MNTKTAPLEKAAAFIVDKRKAFYLIYILLVIFSLFSTNWVSVNNTITDYLSDETETRQGLTLMENEFMTYATAEVMIDNIAYSDAEALCEELRNINGVKEIVFDSSTKHYVDASALFSVTFTGDADDEICETALSEIENETAAYDVYISAELGNTKAETTAKEMNVVMLIACIIILTVLLITSRTYMEITVLILTFGIAAILNKGTNFMFGTISFVSNSIAVVLQLALAILNENRDSVTAWLLKDDKWEEIGVRARGKYVILDTMGTDGTICLQYTPKGFTSVLIIVIISIIIGIVVLTIAKKRTH